MQAVRLIGVGVITLILAGVVFAIVSGPSPQSDSAIELVNVYDPSEAGEDLPSGYRRSLARDDIAPIYDPEFLDAADTAWDDQTLVVGVAIGEEAKAYPVSHLNRREMVIDSMAGIPILVTW